MNIFLAMLLKVGFLLLAVLAQATEQTKCRNFRLGENVIGVGTNNHLYVRRSTSKTFSWILVPQSCCVTQIHVMKNGMILGVGSDRYAFRILSNGDVLSLKFEHNIIQGTHKLIILLKQHVILNI